MFDPIFQHYLAIGRRFLDAILLWSNPDNSWTEASLEYLKNLCDSTYLQTFLFSLLQQISGQTMRGEWGLGEAPSGICCNHPSHKTGNFNFDSQELPICRNPANVQAFALSRAASVTTTPAVRPGSVSRRCQEKMMTQLFGFHWNNICTVTSDRERTARCIGWFISWV